MPITAEDLFQLAYGQADLYTNRHTLPSSNSGLYQRLKHKTYAQLPDFTPYTTPLVYSFLLVPDNTRLLSLRHSHVNNTYTLVRVSASGRKTAFYIRLYITENSFISPSTMSPQKWNSQTPTEQQATNLSPSNNGQLTSTALAIHNKA